MSGFDWYLDCVVHFQRSGTLTVNHDVVGATSDLDSDCFMRHLQDCWHLRSPLSVGRATAPSCSPERISAHRQTARTAREHVAGDHCIPPRRNIAGRAGRCPVCRGCGPPRFAVADVARQTSEADIFRLSTGPTLKPHHILNPRTLRIGAAVRTRGWSARTRSPHCRGLTRAGPSTGGSTAARMPARKPWRCSRCPVGVQDDAGHLPAVHRHRHGQRAVGPWTTATRPWTSPCSGVRRLGRTLLPAGLSSAPSRRLTAACPIGRPCQCGQADAPLLSSRDSKQDAPTTSPPVDDRQRTSVPNAQRRCHVRPRSYEFRQAWSPARSGARWR